MIPIDAYEFPCDSCDYDMNGCCNYDEPLGRFCVLGSAYKPKQPKQLTIFEILADQICEVKNNGNT